MKRNKLTPGSNLMWESSRMMLPEHREQFLEHRRDLRKNSLPVLDEQEREQLDRALLQAFDTQSNIALTLFNPYQNEVWYGRILALNSRQKQLKFMTEDGEPKWIELHSILELSLQP
ncbi:YolD-like family protein [Pullulanibacillus sp. KACC 23026]|uniref:YolD-like family protein n=1 Tax=Pullulanibacillus sp. KACC 23026 TaxID=3028315 RepID=UPI0023AE9404|nr:YolD-like family protein [Pullulanibacillus sp. KACC 23026]WEG14369.1 YolD-like family protein [Pullulanibacillus sp. KACC 23026]